jgi:prepilin-type N-terminal cleavage/methylation domain-containing protein
LRLYRVNKHPIKNLGFTLIELVVVVALVGILAAVALPRMVKNYDGAHEGSVTATGGALASAVILLRSQWVVKGAKGATDNVDGYGDDNIATSELGWPSDADKGAGSSHSSLISADGARCVRLWKSLLVINAPSISEEKSDQTDYWVQLPSGSVCKFYYMKSEQNSRIEYDLENGSVITVL